MPAVTADTLTLSRLPEPGLDEVDRPVVSVTTAPRGFETVTYMIDGTFQHQDSHGGGGVITDGATQWMTAGRGILHIETPPEQLVISGGRFHGIQLWVNLPSSQKMIP